MREVTTTTTVYTYPELNDVAKERVREWWNRAQWDDGVAAERMKDIADERLSAWGDVHGLTYDLYQQGGYPAWSGYVEAWEHSGRKWTVQTDHDRYGMTVTVQPEWETDDDEEPSDAEEVSAREAARDFVDGLSSEIFYAMRDEDEWMGSDEYVSEACESNGYEFTENGELA